MSQDDNKIRQGVTPHQTDESRKLNIENAGVTNHFVDSPEIYSQTQITVDGSELKLAASVLNLRILLNGEITSPLSSVFRGIKFGKSITPPDLMRVLELF